MNQADIAGETSEPHVLVVVPDDYPPVFSDSLAHARLKRMPGVDVVVYESRPENEAELMNRLAGAHTALAVRGGTRFTPAVLEAATSLRHLTIWGTAIDNVDLTSARRLGIAVTNTPDTATVAVAEHTIALMMALAKRIPESDQRIRDGDWPAGMLMQLAGRTMGIIGTGHVGMEVARLARGIGMEVAASKLHPEEDPPAVPPWLRLVELDELLRSADVVSLHARLTPETRRLLGTEQFALMKPTSLFINTARGRLVDEGALAEALRSQAIGGAALDVFSTEPLRRDSPLRHLPNVILSPHTAASTPEAMNTGLMMAVDNAIGFLQGEVRHAVT